MTAIDRTAYPRPDTRLAREELIARYGLAASDLTFMRTNARGDAARLLLATLLKARQNLGYFTMPEVMHPDTITHLGGQLGVRVPRTWSREARRTKSLYRYQAAVRVQVSVRPLSESATRVVTDAVRKAAATMSDPADLINRAIETLQATAIDLPAFSTLDRLASSVRAEVHPRIYNQVTRRRDARASSPRHPQEHRTLGALYPQLRSALRSR